MAARLPGAGAAVDAADPAAGRRDARAARWPRGPADWRADALAGLTGAVVVLPQGVAFATLAGMPPQYGLYAAMVPCVVAALLGSSRLMVTGPANAISLSTMALVAPLALVGSAEYVSLVLTLTFLVGLVQLALGLARAGRLVDVVPHSVIVGFTAGAAVLIAASQVGPFLGIALPATLSAPQRLAAALARLPEAQPAAVLTGLATVAAILAWRPLNRFVPAMLAGVVAGGAVAWALARALPAWAPAATVQALPGALPPLSMPDLSPETVSRLAVPTLVMTLLALTEATAIARAFALRAGDRFDASREFVGQGVANLAGAFFSSYPASGSFNRSALNAASGARTPMAAIFASLLLVAILGLVAPWARLLPLAAISGLLFIVAWGLVDRAEIRRIWREERSQRAALVVTFVATVTVSLEWAILLGIVVALVGQRLAARSGGA